MEPLERNVAQAIHVLRLIEHALHGPSDAWTMEIGPTRRPATPVISECGVRFEAEFPGTPVGDKICLLHDGEVVLAQPLDPIEPDDSAFAVAWDLHPFAVAA